MRDKSMRLFPYLLLTSLFAELLVIYIYFILNKKNGEYFIIYHIYIPIDYLFLGLFFYYAFEKQRIKKVISISIPTFMLISIYLSINIIGFRKYPGLNLNIEGCLLILLSIYRLFTLEPNTNISISKHPVFWICTGLLIYNLGGFIFNGYYNFLIETMSPLAKELNYILNKSFNIILYISFSIAFICSNLTKKYI